WSSLLSTDADFGQAVEHAHVRYDDAIADAETFDDLDTVRAAEAEADGLADRAAALDHEQLGGAGAVERGAALHLQHVGLLGGHDVRLDAQVRMEAGRRRVVELYEQQEPRAVGVRQNAFERAPELVRRRSYVHALAH